ncbi:MAG TPA: DUF4231 domain-containing protein [Sphingomicrobium sp.]|nr:DUF4231 domain-containing protein [Sphingomicrobium sp.]
MNQLKNEASAVRTASSAFFAAGPSRILFVSPLADGADQIGAELALELGFELHAVLPFTRERTRTDLSDDDSRAKFDALLARATCVLELAGEEAHELEAYVMAGRATVAHCDMLIAVWDGLPPRGRGGTGEVVRFAFERATPVVHIPVAAGAGPVLRWSAFDPAIVTVHDDPANVRPFDGEQLRSTLTGLLAPPPDVQEQHFIRVFQRECRRRLRARIEYPLLLAATGVSALRPHHWRPAVASRQTLAEWEEFGEACRKAECVRAPIGTLEQWYEWADSLAGHYAQSYRSGHVFNFVLGALAVLLALTTLVLPEAKKYLAFAEFAAVLAILLNTWAGTRQQWHRRWLDYRQLAERLRPMRSLKVIGVASPDPPGTEANPISGRWVEWYASAVWRAVGCPIGRIEQANVPSLAATIATHELQPQIGYHHSAAHQAERLDVRLEVFGYALFALALVGCVALLAGFWIAPDWVKHNSNWFTMFSAGLPAIGTAVFGIRVQGDYVGSAVRSEHTARVLENIAERLQGEKNLARVADLSEQGARAMLSDLDEWRLLNQQHDLSVG